MRFERARWTRRWVLSRGASFLSLLSAGCVKGDSDSEDPSGQSSDSAGPVDSGDDAFDPCESVDADPTEGWEELRFSDYPRLADVGGSAVVTLQGQSIIVVHVESGCFVALSALCTHEGCAVEYRGGQRVVCPCHGASFLLDGSVQAGPTSIPLERFPATGQGRVVWVKVP